jgi:hypothetical protein
VGLGPGIASEGSYPVKDIDTIWFPESPVIFVGNNGSPTATVAYDVRKLGSPFAKFRPINV